MKNTAVLVAIVVLGTSACASMASFQSADTVRKGEARRGIGATYNKYTITVDDSEEEETVDVGVPALHGWYRYGVTDELELHSMIWIPLGATAGAKYQLLGEQGTRGPSISAGLDIGYLSITSGEGDSEVSTTIIDTHVPLYAGYRLSPGLATYVTPRYLLRTGIADETNISHLVGSAVGVAIGKSTVFHLEAVGMYDLSYGDTTLTGGIGISFL